MAVAENSMWRQYNPPDVTNYAIRREKLIVTLEGFGFLNFINKRMSADWVRKACSQLLGVYLQL